VSDPTDTSPHLGRSAARRPDELSVRELEILGLVAGGARTRDIAQRLGITENTVKSHLTRAYRKIGARNRVQATRLYLARAGAGATAAASAVSWEDDRVQPARPLNGFLARQAIEIERRIEQLEATIKTAAEERSRLQQALGALLDGELAPGSVTTAAQTRDDAGPGGLR
jgi:DNA-binding CsgD family transcriptional regulator